MGGQPDGKDLATGGLDEIAQGLTLALGELGDLGMVGTAGTGRGFGELELSGLELGEETLTATFQSFCERWEWGVRSLINEGNTLAVKTGMSAGTYYETDQYVEGTLKIGLNSLVGNPHASEDAVAQQGWGDIATQSAHADYSKESFDQAYANSLQGWKDAGRDVMTSHTVGPLGLDPENLHSALGVSDSEYDDFLDDTFGPSPEERARTQQNGAAG
ncbi:hypothetical protein [Streptomyces mangrovisoli]|uniref:Uncharacterized protein n=1 Tax=Streptomyces mangrovisoli TaxID=1428628 RepID=A0A1J4NZ20_9ACTN|nr:hypothetical protein [Streptomyces mangrovisoli]OIJ67576.1 hypothetical protein WN71_013105 [Streptomyces mangrovisoli]